MKIINFCKSYFNSFQDVSNYKRSNPKTNALNILKILSYFTVVIPLGIGMLYGVASLFGRINKKPQLSSLDHQVNNRAKKIILKNNPSETVILNKVKEETSKKVLLQKDNKQEDDSSLKKEQLPEILVDDQLKIVISNEIKQKIIKGALTSKEIKEQYETLSKTRNLPSLLGFNAFAPHQFAMLMPGIALIASLLCKKINSLIYGYVNHIKIFKKN